VTPRTGIRLALALSLFNFTSQTAARVVLTLYALELNAPAASVGIIGGLLFLFPLLLSWPIGNLADRKGARGLLLFASACSAASLVLPFFVREVAALYAAAALNGLALAFYHVTLQNIVGTLSKPEDRPRNFSNFSITGSITNFVGPLMAGLAIDHTGHAAACLIIAVPSLVAVGLVLAWGRALPRGKPDAPAASGPGMLADKEVWRMLAVSGLVQLGMDLYAFYLPIYAHAAGLSASAIGAVLATLAVASFIVRLFLARLVKEVATEKLLAVALCMGAMGFSLVPFFSHPVALAAVSFGFGLGMGLGIPLTVILMFSRSAEGRSGQALGLRLTGNNFVRVAGPIVFGAVGTALGIPPVFWINAVLMAAGSLVMLKRHKSKV
jgi:MFS family permease